MNCDRSFRRKLVTEWMMLEVGRKQDGGPELADKNQPEIEAALTKNWKRGPKDVKNLTAWAERYWGEKIQRKAVTA